MTNGTAPIDDCALFKVILEGFGENTSLNNRSCTEPHDDKEPLIVTSAMKFYTYSVPLILAVGVLGNAVSLRVFLSRNMRKLSASTYLAALSTSDIMALLFYVLTEWVRWGVPHLSDQSGKDDFLSQSGVCQVVMYFSYVARFLSAWFIVTFTVERYIGVCHPLRRKDICGSRSAQKVVCSLVFISFIILLYKPVLTSAGIYNMTNSLVHRCFPDPKHSLLSFILDSVYGLFITIIPFVIISILNVLIIRRLLRRRRHHRQCHIVTEESIIRMEFTVILLVVSFVFIVLNVPFCIMWCKRFLLSHNNLEILDAENLSNFDNMEGVLMITRVIFYMNYCVNFFLYSVTGAYFRRELKILVFYRKHKREDVPYVKSFRNNSSHTTPQSWV